MGTLYDCRLFVERMLGAQVDSKPATTQRQFRKRAPSDFTSDALVWIKSDPKYVSAVRAVLSAVCAETALSDQDKEELKLAVGEAVCNAIKHGSPCGNEDHVCVTFSVGDRGVVVRVSDSGGPFARKCRKPRLKIPREGGYGLYLIKSLTSAVQIQSSYSGTTVTLEKRYPVAMRAAG